MALATDSQVADDGCPIPYLDTEATTHYATSGLPSHSLHLHTKHRGQLTFLFACQYFLRSHLITYEMFGAGFPLLPFAYLASLPPFVHSQRTRPPRNDNESE